MRDTFLRLLTGDEKNILHDIMLEDKESGYRAKIMLLKNDGFEVPEIRRATNRHDVNIRKWIHRFNEKCIDGIVSKIHKRRPVKITEEIERRIIEIVANNPRNNYGLLPLST